jgi:hypothetical protein
VIPLIISNRVSASTRDKFLSFGNAFAGGIFLAGGFVHLLAEANTVLHSDEEIIIYYLCSW